VHGSVVLEWRELLDLGLDAFLDDGLPVLVALEGRLGVFHLLEGDARRDRRDVGMGVHVEHGGPVRGKGPVQAAPI
jgi:hypothetical protein